MRESNDVGVTNSFIDIEVALLDMRIFKKELLRDETLTEGVHVVIHVRGIIDHPQNGNAKDHTSDPHH